MSKFLGPIHYWLHSKILLQESIEVSVEEALIAKGYDLADISKWDDLYGRPNPSEDLESQIDQGNIHGWLQRRIGFAETRFAGKLTQLLAAHGETLLDHTVPVFASYGKASAAQAIELGLWDNTLQSAHKLLHNQILEGMPCDHAGAVTINEDNLFQWKSDRCLHQGYWNAVDGQVNHHYVLRDVFNKNFLETLAQVKYERTMLNGSTYYQISR